MERTTERPFYEIAVPHDDISSGNLTLDVFAADLWQVSQNKGPDEYKNAELFFRKTYLTEGLRNLLDVAERRLNGRGGDPVIQVQTPFGGGKTHALIAAYHKAKEWNVKTVVISGTVLSAKPPLWTVIEEQLEGKSEKFRGMSAPGKGEIIDLLAKHQPLLILMDEILEYTTKAAAISAVDSSLAAQTITFMKDLTEAASNLDRTCILITLPSSIIEHYDNQAEKLYQQLQKVTGRVERIYAPVQDSEVAKVIRQRLFKSVDEDAVVSFVSNFMDRAEKEGLLPYGVDPSYYRNRFLESYPFMPELIDVLYHRWGSFPTFQRTRGVLRLLSLIVHSLLNTKREYISVGDVDLGRQDIRQEFIKHIGTEYNTVIAADITGENSNAYAIDHDKDNQNAYQKLCLAKRVATTIFLYSFAGGKEKGITTAEIKRCTTTLENPSSAIDATLEKLKGKLFYIQVLGDKYYFTNQPNLNRIRTIKADNVKEEEIMEYEKELLRKSTGKDKDGKVELDVYIWPRKSQDIPDGREYKLIVLREKNERLIREIFENKGELRRVNRNTIFFTYPVMDRKWFDDTVRQILACRAVNDDVTLALSEEQKKENKRLLENLEKDGLSFIRSLYRMVLIPTSNGYKEIDLGMPTYGHSINLPRDIWRRLKSDEEIFDRIAPTVLVSKYNIQNGNYISTRALLQNIYQTPGEARPTSEDVLRVCIIQGVELGIFGLGELQDNQIICRFYKEKPVVTFDGNEIIISKDICEQIRREEIEVPVDTAGVKPVVSSVEMRMPSSQYVSMSDIRDEIPSTEQLAVSSISDIKDSLSLRFKVPRWKLSDVFGIINFLRNKFEDFELEIAISAKGQGITRQEYEDKVVEALNQMGVKLLDT